MLSRRRVAILAVISVPLAWALALTSGTIWEATGDESPDGPEAFTAVTTWLKANLPLVRDGEPVWGWRELFFVAPLLALPAAFDVARAPFATATGRRAARVMAWSLAAATVSVMAAYNIGVGWPFDLLAILVATIAATVTGVSLLRHGGPGRRHQAIALTLAVPLLPVAGFAALLYPSPAIFIGLLAALAWYAVVASLESRAA